MSVDCAFNEDVVDDPQGQFVMAEEALARVAELAASLDMADRAGLELAKQLEVANARVAEQRDAIKQNCIAAQELADERNAANARVAALESSLLDKVHVLERYAELRDKVERCKAVLSRRYSEPGHWENPDGELCSADELEAALEDK